VLRATTVRNASRANGIGSHALRRFSDVHSSRGHVSQIEGEDLRVAPEIWNEFPIRQRVREDSISACGPASGSGGGLPAPIVRVMLEIIPYTIRTESTVSATRKSTAMPASPLASVAETPNSGSGRVNRLFTIVEHALVLSMSLWEAIMAPLIFSCPLTRRPIEDGIETDLSSVRTITIRVHCPHCWQRHALTIKDGHVASASS